MPLPRVQPGQTITAEHVNRVAQYVEDLERRLAVRFGTPARRISWQGSGVRSRWRPVTCWTAFRVRYGTFVEVPGALSPELAGAGAGSAYPCVAG